MALLDLVNFERAPPPPIPLPIAGAHIHVCLPAVLNVIVSIVFCCNCGSLGECLCVLLGLSVGDTIMKI